MLIISSWIFWIILSLIGLYHPDAGSIPPNQCHIAHPYFSQIFLTLIWIFLFTLMAAVIVLESLTIYHVKKHFRGMMKTNVQQGKETEQQKRLLSRISTMSQIIALILGSYVISWGPYSVALMLLTLCPQCGIQGQHLMYLTLVISLNSAANVVIFGVKSKEFRIAFKNMWQCNRTRVEDLDHSTGTAH